jgi:hypothetical protein
MLYNPDFNCTEFGTNKNAAGSNQWQGSSEVREKEMVEKFDQFKVFSQYI